MEIKTNTQQIDSVSHSQKPSFEKIQKNSNNENQGNEVQDEGLSDKLESIVNKLNKQMDSLGTNIRFAYNDEFGSMYIKVTERDTGNVIRQIPTEEAMRLTQYFKDAIGMIFDKES